MTVSSSQKLLQHMFQPLKSQHERLALRPVSIHQEISLRQEAQQILFFAIGASGVIVEGAR